MSAPEPKPAARPRRLRRALVVLTALIAVAIAALLWLGFSEAGLRFIVARAVPLAAEAGIEIGGVHGHLFGAMRVDTLHITAGDTQVAIDALRIVPVWPALLANQVHLRALELGAVRIERPVAASQPFDLDSLPSPQWPALGVPLGVRIDALRIAHLSLHEGKVETLSGELQAGLRLDRRGLTLDQTAFRGTPLTVHAQAELPLRVDGTVKAAIDWQYSDPNGSYQGRLKLGGTPAALTIDQRLERPLAVTLKGRLDPGFGSAAPWNPGLNLHADWAALAGTPLAALLPPGLQVAAGTLDLDGHLRDHHLRLHGGLRYQDTPPLKIALDGRGDGNGLNIEQLHVTAPAADAATAVDANGRITWQGVPRTDLNLALTDLNPALWLPDWPGQLNTRLHLKAEATPGGQLAAADLHIVSLDGSLRDAPVNGAGDLAWKDGELRIDTLKLRSGDNRLSLQARVRDLTAKPRLVLHGRLQLPTPDTLLPGARGHISAEVDADGVWPTPDLALKANAEDFAWPAQDIAAQQLTLTLQLGPDRMHGLLRSKGVELAGLALERGDIGVGGTLADHRIDATLSLPLGKDTLKLETQAQGGWQEAQAHWQGQIRKLNLLSEGLGVWNLAAPVALSAGANRVELAEACLDGRAGKVCGNGGWTPQDGPRARARVTQLAASRLVRALDAIAGVELPPTVAAIDARFDAEAELVGDHIDAGVQPTAGQLRWRDPPLDFPASTGFQLKAARYHADAASGTLDLALTLDQRAELQAHLQQGVKGDAQALDGHLLIESAKLEWLAAMLPGVADLRGDVRIQARLGGRRDAPSLDADGRLRIEQAQLAELGTRINGAELRLQSRPDGRTLDIDGEVPISAPADTDHPALNGTLRIRGEAATDASRLSLNVDGGPVPVLRLPDLRLDASPKLHFERLAGKQRLSGEIDVPSVDYHLADLPKSTLQVSPDQVIVGADAPAEGPKPPPPIAAGVDADVTVKLGDDVRIAAFDLKAQLKGRVRLLINADGKPGSQRAEGRIDIPEGSYKAYGQQLKLTRGHLLFAGPPDNPTLDLRATRDSEDGTVVAYLDVGGNLQAPQLKVGTTPASNTDAEALAYLLTGKPLDQAGKGGKIDIYAAALSLGLDKGTPQLAAIRRELGLDEFGIEAGARLEDTTVKLGKYLNPNLFVGYSLNVFDNTGAVLARLRLGDGLDVEARSAMTQSVDLIYRIDSD